MSKHIKKHAGRHVVRTLIALLILALIVCGVYFLLLRKENRITNRLAELANATEAPVVTPSATPTPEPTPEATDEPEETDEPEVTSAPVETTTVPTAEPTAVPTEAPTAVPPVEVTTEPVPVATTEPTAEPTAEPTPEPTAEPTAEPTTEPTPEPVTLEFPYYIEVDRGMQVVRVYTVGPDGTYSILARTMICSTDQYGTKPPNGLYRMDGSKYPWIITVNETNAQYATRIAGKILFHSAVYKVQYHGTELMGDTYKELGSPASLGCVRLCAADAKWIYDNVPAGTAVRFMTGTYDEVLLGQLAVPPLGKSGYDPTDPRDSNPDYDPSYEESKPMVTPFPGVTPAPTDDWVFNEYTSGN